MLKVKSFLVMLNLMERFPLAEYGFHSTEALHVMIEAKKLAYADMIRYVGDPQFSRIPIAEMLSKPHAAEVLVSGGKAPLVRPRQSLDDLVRGESIPPSD